MAEHRVSIDGGVDSNGNIVRPLPVSLPASSPFYPSSNPSITGAYLFSVENLVGVAAPNVYLSIYNPLGSGRNYATSGSFVSCAAGGAAGSTRSMRVYRITGAPTGGSVQAASTVCKLNSLYRDTNADIRIGGPTVTLGPAFSNTPPPVTSGAGGGQYVHGIEIPPGSPPFVLAPGEGVAFHNVLGDVDQVWNITIAWAEADI